MQLEEKDKKYMQRCLELARQAKALGYTAVGSLIVKDDKVIGEGCEGAESLPEMMKHAELAAIITAKSHQNSQYLEKCTLYTTVEPCFMCAYLIRQSRISRVVYGIPTPEVGGASSEFPFLTSAEFTKWPEPPEVVSGVLAEACEALL